MKTIVLVLGVLFSASVFAMSANKANLTRDEATLRARQVSHVKYDLKFDLSLAGDSFGGQALIQFVWSGDKKPLRIDFSEGQVQSLRVNDVEVKSNHNQMFLTVDAKNLKTGTNVIEINYTHPYTNDGGGLYRFTDPEDKKVYLYSNLEPYDANRIFPCFDQPDLKANYSMQVKAPKDWTVITSVRESKVEKAGEVQNWIFPESEKFSTYIWSLHAGPYHSWQSRAGKIPLRLFARQSLSRYVKPNDWFTWSKQGFAFYENYFDYKYPYKKYDQVIVPDFNAGAMENVAAVTFSERYITRGDYSQELRLDTASVIMHEMAHMWFGNLVTMKWWNDLWLNESFATYMAGIALEATEFKNVTWRNFYWDKLWAYREDQWVTTHPIEAPIESTDDAFTNFDGITYGKGAALQKQLNFYLGQNVFRQGVRNYFKKYAGGNTELTDFMGALSEASGMDLGHWSQVWLRTASLNTIQTSFQCQADKSTKLTLIQTAPKDYPTLRFQKTKVAFLKLKDKKLVVDHSLEVLFQGERSEQVVAHACPDAVYPNYEDHAYVKVALDPVSLKTVQDQLHNVQNPFLRQMLWATMWDMVREAKLSVKTYADMALRLLPKERDEKIIMAILSSIYSNRYDSVYFYYPHATEQEQVEFKSFAEKMEMMFWTELNKAKPGSDVQKFYYQALVSTSTSPFAQEKARGFLAGKVKIPGLKIDQDLRWRLILYLSWNNDPQTESYIVKELEKDKSLTAQNISIAARAAFPEAKSKQEWLKKVNDPKAFENLKQAQSAMRYIFPRTQEDLQEKYAEEFFTNLSRLAKTESQSFLESYVELAPRECYEGSKDRLGRYLNNNKNLQPAVVKELKITRQEGEICRAIRAKARQ